jgi:DNA repair exonuclease SbcCD nuclease subunit
MKIGIISDIHLHKHQSFSGANGRRRLDDGLKVLKHSILTFLERDCTALVILGDLLHSRKYLDVETFQEIRSCLCSLPLDEFVHKFALVGNHEWYDRSRTITGLSFLEEFGFTVVGRLEYEDTKDGMLIFVPWAPVKEIENDLVNLWRRKGFENLNALFIHATIDGSKSSSGFKFKGAARLGEAAKHFKQVFAGDIHDRQFIKPNITVCGSPMHLNFGDFGSDKGIHIYNTSTNVVEYATLADVYPKFILTDDPSQINDRDYFRLITNDGTIKQDNVEVVLVREHKVGKRRLDISTFTSTENVLGQYIDKYGMNSGFDIPKLTRIGNEVVNEVR